MQKIGEERGNQKKEHKKVYKRKSNLNNKKKLFSITCCCCQVQLLFYDDGDLLLFFASFQKNKNQIILLLSLLLSHVFVSKKTMKNVSERIVLEENFSRQETSAGFPSSVSSQRSTPPFVTSHLTDQKFRKQLYPSQRISLSLSLSRVSSNTGISTRKSVEQRTTNSFLPTQFYVFNSMLPICGYLFSHVSSTSCCPWEPQFDWRGFLKASHNSLCDCETEPRDVLIFQGKERKVQSG